MAIYSQNDIVSGKKTLKNGAIAGYVIDKESGKEVWRIVKGGVPPANRTRKEITLKEAQRAFNKYWKNRIDSAKTPESKRAYKAAWVRDINYGRPVGLRTTTSYKRNPGRLEFEGVDYGSKRYKAPTQKQLTNLAKGRELRGKSVKAEVKELTTDQLEAIKMLEQDISQLAEYCESFMAGENIYTQEEVNAFVADIISKYGLSRRQLQSGTSLDAITNNCTILSMRLDDILSAFQ